MLVRFAAPLLALVLAASMSAPPAVSPGGGVPLALVRDGLSDSLVSLEKQSWVAWKGRDGSFFQSFLSDDHVEVGFGGITRKATVVAGVASPACIVHSYAVDHFETTRLTPTTALLTYHAAQQTECGGHPVPSPVWVSSLYVLRDGRWQNAVYQQTQTSR